MKKKSPTATNFAVLAITAILLFLLAEVGLRIYYAITGKIIAADKEEECNKLLFRKISNPSTINRFNPGFTSYLEYSNYSGIMPKANLDFNDVFRVKKGKPELKFILADDKTNAYHIRALKNFSYKKNPTLLRIALFGDSFTWGADVHFKYTYGSILEELIPNSEVLNFGVEGAGIDTMYLRWKYEALQLNPDIVVFAVYIDDIRRVQSCMYKPKFIRKEEKLEITNLPPPSYEEILKAYKEPKTISYFLKRLLYTVNNIGGIKKEYEHGLGILELILKEINFKSQKDQTYFMAVIIEAGNDHINNEIELHYINRTKEMLRKMQIPYIASREMFDEEQFIPIDESSTGKYGHFTPEGYGLLAQGIKNKLEKESIVQKQKDFYFRWRKTDSALFLINKRNMSDVQKIIPYSPLNEPYIEIEKKYLISEHAEINGKPAYISSKDGKKFIVYDGQEIGKEYDSVDFLAEFNSKLMYIASKDGKKFIVYDGQEIGKEYDSKFNGYT